jgi:hypothetical protein
MNAVPAISGARNRAPLRHLRQAVLTARGQTGGGGFELGRSLFLLGHMRAGTSVLGQILTNSSHVVGYGETHLRYRRVADLSALAAEVGLSAMPKPLGVEPQYLFDKVLHDYITPQALQEIRPWCLFMVREPVGAVNSLFRLPNARSRAARVGYYVRRLHELANLWELVPPQRRRLVDYDNLVANPQGVLASLSQWLELRSSLKPHFAVDQRALRPGAGDPSGRLRSGVLGPQTCAAQRSELTADEELWLRWSWNRFLQVTRDD